MEFLLSLQTAIAGTFFASLLLFLSHLLNLQKLAKKNLGSSKIAPRAAGAWPIIGHLHLLARSPLPHVLLCDMADKHGSIFTIKLGVHEAFVVSDWKMAKECYTTNDKVFNDRLKSSAIELMGYNYAMFGLNPYGHYWRHMHRTIKQELLSNKKVKLTSKIQVSEVKEAIKDVHKTWSDLNKGRCSSDLKKVEIEMKQWFESLSLNMVVRIVAGKRYNLDDQEGSRSLAALKKFYELMGVYVISDVIPFLRHLDLGGHVKEMKTVGKEIDYILNGWLEEHKRNKVNSELAKKLSLEGEEEDFMDVLLSVLEGSSNEDLGGYDKDTVVKATCLAILIGSTDATTACLIWTLSLLLNNPDTLKKAQHELDIQVGRNRQVEESDIKKLIYLQAILKESMRLYPPGPIPIPRECTEDCIVGGYKIPKGTRLILNLSKIHRDPLVWSNPCEFQPERFFTRNKDVDFRGQHFELLPFGAGRRICPGIPLAVQGLVLTLASIIQEFDLSTPMDEKIDMTEVSALINIKGTPLKVFLSPRAPILI